jgi:hypothetical protein
MRGSLPNLSQREAVGSGPVDRPPQVQYRPIKLAGNGTVQADITFSLPSACYLSCHPTARSGTIPRAVSKVLGARGFASQ